MLQWIFLTILLWIWTFGLGFDSPTKPAFCFGFLVAVLGLALSLVLDCVLALRCIGRVGFPWLPDFHVPWTWPCRVPSVRGFGMAVPLWTFLLFAVRVGEAAHPGPSWSIGVANLSGLNNRAFAVAETTVDSWLFSETHLTVGGEAAFRSGLRDAKSHFTSYVGGFPVPPRSTASEIGQWSGVGALSRFPIRRLPHSWPDLVYRSGRMVPVSICCHGIWVSGIIMYGTPIPGLLM